MKIPELQRVVTGCTESSGYGTGRVFVDLGFDENALVALVKLQKGDPVVIHFLGERC